nr:S8 family serine peptidase [Actinomycetes bacterium]
MLTSLKVKLALSLSSAALVATACSAESTPAPTEAEAWFAFGLARDQPGLVDRVLGIAVPNADQYQQYLSTDQIATDFGADPGIASQALETLVAAGFSGQVDASGGVVVGSFSVAEAQAFFGVEIQVITNSDGTTSIAPAETLTVPDALPEQVTEVFGGRATLSNLTAASSDSPSMSAASPDCPEDTPAARTRKEINDLYGLKSLYAAGLSGKGVRVGLLEIDVYSEDAIDLYTRCLGYPMPDIAVTSVNATAEQLTQTNTESSLDIVSLGLAAPGLSEADLIQFDQNSSLIFPFAHVVNQQADTKTSLDLISTSVAFCAAEMDPSELLMTEWLLAAAAATGLTVVASSGDSGSSGCYPGSESAGVQYPSESAFALSVGGTQLTADGGQSQASDRSTASTGSQAVWSEAPGQNFAGGGGPSTNFGRPPYQDATGLDQSMRQTPDIAFVASPSDLGPIAVCSPNSACEFESVAGTSAAAPAVAGALALVLEKRADGTGEQASTSRLGLLNPWLYTAASTAKTADVAIDVVQGNNDLFGTGCCVAQQGYDMAS